MFILYSADLVDIAEKHGVTIHSFVDDTQLYLHCGRDETVQTTVRLEQCITDIDHWMSANRLKLNADKPELLWVGTKYCLSVCVCVCFPVYDSVQILFLQVSTSHHADLSLEKHASNISATGFHHLRQLRRIRRSVNRDSAATLVHAFMTSRVDYCNALFAAAPKVTTNKLQ